MKKISVLILILIVITYISCERDDICAESTPTTPRLLIDFLLDQDNVKSVSNLRVTGVDNNTILSDDSAASNIILPLRTDASTTQYILWKEYEVNDNGTPDDASDDFIEGGNMDTITINYSREEVYVSRACGYKTIFNNVTITIETDSDNWILSRDSKEDNQSVEDETEAHFYLYH